MNYERSCGGVLFTVKNNIPYFVLVEENYYGFPKGHMEPGETERKTALREIREETGVNAAIVGDFRKVDHYILKHKPDTEKTVVYFLAYYEDQEIVYQEEYNYEQEKSSPGRCLQNSDRNNGRKAQLYSGSRSGRAGD